MHVRWGMLALLTPPALAQPGCKIIVKTYMKVNKPRVGIDRLFWGASRVFHIRALFADLPKLTPHLQPQIVNSPVQLKQLCRV